MKQNYDVHSKSYTTFSKISTNTTGNISSKCTVHISMQSAFPKFESVLASMINKITVEICTALFVHVFTDKVK